MEPKERIELAIKYIEENLKSDVRLACAAREAGYSEYHFLRVFKRITRLTPADYIRKRRLSEIAREMERGGRSMSEIAYEYGFNSKENFTRAFKSEHKVLPTDYRSAGNSLKLFEPFITAAPSFEIEPRIETLDPFSLTVFPNEWETAPKFWNVYNCNNLSLRLSGGNIVADYGVGDWDDEKKEFDYYIGIRADEAGGDMSGTITLDIPGGLYAVSSTPAASHTDFVGTIHRTWDYILGVWMPKSPYRCDFSRRYRFETYVEASRTYSEDIYIPIVCRDGLKAPF